MPLYEAWSSFLPDDLDAHLENLKSNKAFWKGKSEQGQPIEKVFIPKFSVSVLRIRGSISTPKVNSSHQRKKSSSVVSSKPPVLNPPSGRPSLITKIIRRFSVSSRVVSPEVVAVQEEVRDKEEEEFDEIVILDGERKQSVSTDDLSKSEVAAIEMVEKSNNTAQSVYSADSRMNYKEVSTEAPKKSMKSEKEETSVQLAEIAEAVRSNLEVENEPAEEFPRSVYSISKRRKSISYHDINTAKKTLDINNPIDGSSTTSLLATNSSIVGRSASVIGFDGFDAVENRSQASDLGTDSSLSPSI